MTTTVIGTTSTCGACGTSCPGNPFFFSSGLANSGVPFRPADRGGLTDMIPSSIFFTGTSICQIVTLRVGGITSWYGPGSGWCTRTGNTTLLARFYHRTNRLVFGNKAFYHQDRCRCISFVSGRAHANFIILIATLAFFCSSKDLGSF